MAVKINEPVKIIQDYENAKGIPNPAVLVKLEKILEVKLRGKDIGSPIEKK